jgi:hypothetical protein
MAADELVEAACVVMHDAYEEAAAGAGWVTNPASRKPWAEVPEANKVTMRAAVRALLEWQDDQQPANPTARLEPGDRLLVIVAPGVIRTTEDADDFSERLTGFLNGNGQLAVVEGQQAVIVPADYTVPVSRVFAGDPLQPIGDVDYPRQPTGWSAGLERKNDEETADRLVGRAHDEEQP